MGTLGLLKTRKRFALINPSRNSPKRILLLKLINNSRIILCTRERKFNNKSTTWEAYSSNSSSNNSNQSKEFKIQSTDQASIAKSTSNKWTRTSTNEIPKRDSCRLITRKVCKSNPKTCQLGISYNRSNKLSELISSPRTDNKKSHPRRRRSRISDSSKLSPISRATVVIISW